MGNVESIEAMAPEALARFYQDWYRSDRMAVVAVGDFDVIEMEDRITTTFGSMAKPDDARTGPAGEAPTDRIHRRAASLADAEIALDIDPGHLDPSEGGNQNGGRCPKTNTPSRPP